MRDRLLRASLAGLLTLSCKPLEQRETRLVDASDSGTRYAPATILEHRSFVQSLAMPDWGTLRYIDQGQGPVIVLLHGVPTSSWLYRKVIPLLVDQGYRVIAPDMIGFGASDKPRDTSLLTPVRHARRLLALMDHLGIEGWTHVCHDAGGPWTWELMQMAPGRVQRLVVLNTIVDREGWRPPLRLRLDSALSRTARRALMSDITGPGWTRVLIDGGLRRPRRIRTPAMLDGYAMSMSEGTANAIIHFMGSLSRIERALPRFQRTLAAFEGPAMIIWGKHDSILRAEQQVPTITSLLEIPPSDVHVLPRAKHFIQEEEPRKLAAWIGEFAGRPAAPR